MNTPAHAVLNLALLTSGERRVDAGPVLAGAVVPDLPMFAFFLWQTLWIGAPQAEIWGEAYFRDTWQDFFDLFNSLPLAALLLVAGFWTRRRGLQLFSSSLILHCLLDLPFHREDGHRHFFPLSDWRFMSPVSYWDPGHFGSQFALLEALGVLVASAVLWRRFPTGLARACLVFVGAIYAAGGLALTLGLASP